MQGVRVQTDVPLDRTNLTLHILTPEKEGVLVVQVEKVQWAEVRAVDN